MNLDQMAAEWLKEKAAERAAVERRRELEDAIREAANIRSDVEGTKTLDLDGLQVKVVSRIDRKVDGDKVQELAAEHGLTDHLGSLFRWRPEINSAAWKAADESITKPLAAAITAKPGRPSFSVIVEKK